MIQAIEYAENNDPQNAISLGNDAWNGCKSEVKKHLLDPHSYMRRKGEYYLTWLISLSIHLDG